MFFTLILLLLLTLIVIPALLGLLFILTGKLFLLILLLLPLYFRIYLEWGLLLFIIFICFGSQKVVFIFYVLY